jgi:hypothetical protein
VIAARKAFTPAMPGLDVGAAGWPPGFAAGFTAAAADFWTTNICSGRLAAAAAAVSAGFDAGPGSFAVGVGLAPDEGLAASMSFLGPAFRSSVQVLHI